MSAVAEAPVMQEKRAVLPYKPLVSGKLWNRLVGRIQKDHPEIKKNEAEAIMDAALGFLKLCANHPENRFAPSEKVDIGWHTFLMYTREYHEFCRDLGGNYIHHVPNDDPRVPQERGALGKTVRFMRTNGVTFSPRLWFGNADCTVDCRDDCSNCSQNSCTK